MSFDEGSTGPTQISTHVEDWRDEVIYQVLIDRFADGDAGNNFRVDTTSMAHWHGGDWKGLEDHLDYVEALGVTTLWISPVIKNVDTDAGFDGYHGYWAQDLTQTNPHFGDVVALRHLVDAAHQRGIKVILDIVTNHMSQLFYYDINKNGQPDKDTFGSGEGGKSPVNNVTEYDPDFDPRGIQARTSLGESGPAPIIFAFDPATNHMPPMPELLQDPGVYNRKGRTFDYENGDQLLHGDFPGGLKDLKTTRCDVKKLMVDSYARWVEIADFDGFRIDTLKHVEPEFWRYFTQKLRQRLAKAGKKNFFMFGEAFDGRDHFIGSFTKNGDVPLPPPDNTPITGLLPDLDRENQCVDDGVPLNADQVDGVFYFSQSFQVFRDVFRYSAPTKQIASLWDARPVNYGTTPAKDATGLPPTKTLVNFLDNHDIPRFLWDQNFPEFASGLSSDDYRRLRTTKLKNALLFLLTEDGIPCIYYGTEQGFEGGNDPANREDLWETGYDTSNEVFSWVKQISGLRKKFSSLRRGDLKVVYATDHTGGEPDAGIFAFERAGGDAGAGYSLVVFNTNAEHDSSPGDGNTKLTLSVPAGTVLRDVVSGSTTDFVVASDGSLAITLPPLSGAILVPQDQLSGN